MELLERVRHLGKQLRMSPFSTRDYLELTSRIPWTLASVMVLSGASVSELGLPLHEGARVQATTLDRGVVHALWKKKKFFSCFRKKTILGNEFSNCSPA